MLFKILDIIHKVIVLARSVFSRIVRRFLNSILFIYSGGRGFLYFGGEVFDTEWYAALNKDVEDYKDGFFEHYLRHGIFENRVARFFDSNTYLRTYSDIKSLHIGAWKHYNMFGRSEGRTARFFYVHSEIERGHNRNYDEWQAAYDESTEQNLSKISEAIDIFNLNTIFDLYVYADGSNSGSLKKVLDGVAGQSYRKWTCFVLMGSHNSREIRELVSNFVRNDKRFVLVETTDDINLKSSIGEGKGSFLSFLDTFFVLSRDALFWAAFAIAENPRASLIYADEDQINESGRRVSPYFKPKFNYELMLTHNLTGPFSVYCRDSLCKIEIDFFQKFEELRYDITLRFFEEFGAVAIEHIPRVLSHVLALGPGSAQPAIIKRHFARIGVHADVFSDSKLSRYNRIKYQLSQRSPLVSIIIPTRDRVELLKVCVDSVLEKSSYSNFELIIIDNGSVEKETFEYLETLDKSRVTIIQDDRAFNFSALNNLGVANSKGEFICLMNNDIEIITSDWLEEMLGLATQKDIGCVGARLWYPDNTLQHAGVLVGFHGVAGHLFKHLPRDTESYANRASLLQSLSAVTGAVLLVKKSIYWEVGGLDEELAVAFNDVDFCLKVRDLGYRNVYTPYAEMYHHESASRGSEDSPEKKAREASEIAIIKERYGDSLMKDPSFSPNLSLTSESVSFAFPPRVLSISQLLTKFTQPD